MAVRSVWTCDVCNEEVKSDEIFELRAYSHLHIHVCEKCLGEEVSKAARTTKELKD